MHQDLFTVGAVDQNVMNLLGIILEGSIQIKLYSFASARKIALVKLDLSAQDCQPMTVMAPSLMLSLLSGIIRSSSNSILYPRPKHTGQAPKGLLKEKLLGSTSLTLIPQSGQESSG